MINKIDDGSGVLDFEDFLTVSNCSFHINKSTKNNQPVWVCLPSCCYGIRVFMNFVVFLFDIHDHDFLDFLVCYIIIVYFR